MMGGRSWRSTRGKRREAERREGKMRKKSRQRILLSGLFSHLSFASSTRFPLTTSSGGVDGGNHRKWKRRKAINLISSRPPDD